MPFGRPSIGDSSGLRPNSFVKQGMLLSRLEQLMCAKTFSIGIVVSFRINLESPYLVKHTSNASFPCQLRPAHQK
jgi:hypothetical protein